MVLVDAVHYFVVVFKPARHGAVRQMRTYRNVLSVTYEDYLLPENWYICTSEKPKRGDV